MKVLVTGGGGFLGSYVVKELLKRDYDVLNVSRNSYIELESLGVKTFKADLSVENSLSDLDLSDFSYVIHIAAKAGVWGSYSSFYNANFLSTKNLVSHVSKFENIKGIIYTSTPSVVFGKDDIILGDESLEYPKKYYTHYAKTKSMAESLILEFSNEQTKTVAIRPHLIWGPGDPHLFPRLLSKAKEGKLKRVGEGSNLVDIVYVENAAIAHVDAMEAINSGKDIGGNAYFIGQDKPVNLWDFINDILVRAKIDPVEDSVSYSMAYKVGAILEVCFKTLGILNPEPPMTRFVAMQLAKSHYFSHEKAKRDFGYQSKISVEEGLKRYFAEKVGC